MKKNSKSNLKPKIRKKKNKKQNKSVKTTLDILQGSRQQIYGFGHNDVILNKTYVTEVNSFTRMSLVSVFGEQEFQKRLGLFKYLKVNNVVVSFLPAGLSINVNNTVMFSWTNPGLIEGDVTNNDSARNISGYLTKPKHFSWKPPNNVVNNSDYAFALNKPFDVNLWNKCPGWLYVITGAYALKFVLAINVTFISNNINYQPTEKECQIKVMLVSDKFKVMSFPVIKNDKKDN